MTKYCYSCNTVVNEETYRDMTMLIDIIEKYRDMGVFDSMLRFHNADVSEVHLIRHYWIGEDDVWNGVFCSDCIFSSLKVF